MPGVLPARTTTWTHALQDPSRDAHWMRKNPRREDQYRIESLMPS
jgi:hypothetical protein